MFAAKWAELEDIVLSKVSQTQKNKYQMCLQERQWVGLIEVEWKGEGVFQQAKKRRK
jgi:hypothetical protein